MKGGTDEIGRNHYKHSQVPGPQILTELRIQLESEEEKQEGTKFHVNLEGEITKQDQGKITKSL